MDGVDAVATGNTPAILADVSCWPHLTDWTERGRHLVHRARNIDAMRTMAMRTMDSITRIFTDSRSVPKIIGMGPISRMPPPRAFVPALADLVARRITAINARTNPMSTRPNPIVAMEISFNDLQS